ncbi:MucR family transcriptional regulator [Promicromonospora sp. NPDC057488]|uniref:MucR family transcriptional regulator n=1 Tax=Promicromonospora sp. NPDC057488 TaxID=3346147 RepID=UPI00366D58AC
MPRAQDKVQCAECSRWFVSVANHVLPAHGITADEYRATHGLLKSDPLIGRDLQEWRQEIGARRMRDPEQRGLLLSVGFRARPENTRQPRDPHATQRVGRSHMERSARWWRDRLAVIGCETLDDASAWAAERNVGWAEVAQAIGVSPTHLRATAKKQGVRARRRITPHQQRMLDLVSQYVAEHGPLWWIPDQRDLGRWLSVQRRALASGRPRSTVHDRLDEIDPDWHLRHGEREPVCTREECESVAVTRGLCQRHSEQLFRSQRRAARNAGVDLVACQECGSVFRTLKAHLRQVHHMTTQEYQTKHRVGPSALDSPAVDAARAASTAQMWAERLGLAGWTSWQEAAHWAVSDDVGWPEVGARMGASWRMAQAQARAAGITIPRRKHNARHHHADTAMQATAVTLGFTDLAGLLEQTRHLNDVEFGELVGLGQGPAATFRRRHGIPTPGRNTPRRTEQVESAAAARWQTRLQAVGWTTWDDAISWAIEHNSAWDGVATHLGVSPALLRKWIAKRDDIPTMPRKLTAEEIGLLDLARTLQAETGTLQPAHPERLESWLVRQRRRRDNDVTTRAMIELSRIDPAW